MDKLLTKKTILTTSALYLAFLAAVFLYGEKCYDVHWCYTYLNYAMGLIAVVFLPFLPTFFFSLITYFMRDEVFQPWKNLVKWWVPISILLILIMPSSNGSFLPIDKDHIAILVSGLFTLLSLVIVATAFFASRKK